MITKTLTAKTLFARVVLAAMLLAAVMMVCSLIGTQEISLKNVLAGSMQASVNPDYEIFIRVRLPRIILAAIVGAALACAGVVFQAILRNPLADPYILGVSSGAGLGAIIPVFCGLTWTLWGRSPIAIFAFVGAAVTVWLVWVIGKAAGKSNVIGLLLAGVVINSFFSAVIMFLTSIGGERVFTTVFWLMGNMSEEDYFILYFAGGAVISGIVALYFIAPHLNLITFGQAEAKTMGINTIFVQAFAFVTASFITAVAVSLSGLIGFVGLLIPHSIRLVFGPDHRQLLPLSAFVGAAFLIIADTIARVIVTPAQLPVGVVTAMAGGPFFLILLIKYSRKIGWMAK